MCNRHGIIKLDHLEVNKKNNEQEQHIQFIFMNEENYSLYV